LVRGGVGEGEETGTKRGNEEKEKKKKKGVKGFFGEVKNIGYQEQKEDGKKVRGSW